MLESMFFKEEWNISPTSIFVNEKGSFFSRLKSRQKKIKNTRIVWISPLSKNEKPLLHISSIQINPNVSSRKFNSPSVTSKANFILKSKNAQAKKFDGNITNILNPKASLFLQGKGHVKSNSYENIVKQYK